MLEALRSSYFQSSTASSTLLSSVGAMPCKNIVSFQRHQKKPISRGTSWRRWRWCHWTKCAGESVIYKYVCCFIRFLLDTPIAPNISCMHITRASMVWMLHGPARNIKVIVSFQRLFFLLLISQTLYLPNIILRVIFKLRFSLHWLQARRRAP